MSILAISAHGIPQVQGNHRIGHRGRHTQIYDANPNLGQWREQLTLLARTARIRRHLGTFTGPVELQVKFWLARPQSAPRTIDVWPLTRGGGDVDKLLRPIGDSLVDAGAIGDDSQIVIVGATKRYAVGRDLPKIYVEHFHWASPGALIQLSEVTG